ncbi:unnamed protein product [Effrenium voratum]|uniref:Uncharacterized protein n=1 Tax=Effrenium voratum TaxID=2562239 RepID=A0AA36HW45_9DINO|nr:unnamed protein product [Effrenium voratum]
MWQWPALNAVKQSGNVQCVAFYQFDFQAQVAKPTRLLLRTAGPLQDFMCTEMPKFDTAGVYLGPLPRRHIPAMKQRGHGGFATTGSEQWPSEMCKWVAEQVMTSWNSRSQKLDEGEVTVHSPVDQKEVKQPGEQTTGSKQPQQAAVPDTNQQRIRRCRAPGNFRPYHDGAGLCSPGRCDLADRRWADIPPLRDELEGCVYRAVGGRENLELEAFHMAIKGEAGCCLVQNEGLKSELRNIVVNWLKRRGSGRSDLGRCADGQPFFLPLMSELLREVGDPDWSFLLQGEEGFPAGILRPLPRTPAVYEEQTSWKLDEGMWYQATQWADNYHSVAEHEQFVRESFDQEVDEGLMEKLTTQELRERYGNNVAVASLAVLVEDSHGAKKRIIHDGSNHVCVNHRIRCRDKLRSPGAREKLYLLDYYRSSATCLFSLVGDISKAHRRFRYHPSERGMLACRVSSADNHVYINKVGTFGIGSAAYWWSRISGQVSGWCFNS